MGELPWNWCRGGQSRWGPWLPVAGGLHCASHKKCVTTSFWVLWSGSPVWKWGVLCSFVACWHSDSPASATAKSLQSCPTLCDPRDGSPLDSPIPGILQARTLEWVAISFSNAWKWKVKVKLLSRVLTLRNPMDCSLPGSPIHGIFQARVLEWGAIAVSANSPTGQ